MSRREFITLLVATTAICLPRAAWAQPSQQMRRVDVVLGLRETDPEAQARIREFRMGMRDYEWFEGRNVHIEYRYAGSDFDVINKHVTEVVKLGPDVIVGNSTPVMASLHRATRKIPIVFAVVNNPVGQGFISSLSRPGGNVTGFSFIEPEIVGKWINLLSDSKPGLSRVALMFNPGTAPYYDAYIRSFKGMPRRTPVQLEAMHVQSIADIDPAIAKLAREPGAGLLVAGDPFILVAREAILSSAVQYGVPIISPYRQFVAEGSLMSYGPDTGDIFRRAASYVNRILRGAPPSSLPAQSPVKFELAVNLKTAKTLGLSVREAFLQLADEVIE